MHLITLGVDRFVGFTVHLGFILRRELGLLSCLYQYITPTYSLLQTHPHCRLLRVLITFILLVEALRSFRVPNFLSLVPVLRPESAGLSLFRYFYPSLLGPRCCVNKEDLDNWLYARFPTSINVALR